MIISAISCSLTIEAWLLLVLSFLSVATAMPAPITFPYNEDFRDATSQLSNTDFVQHSTLEPKILLPRETLMTAVVQYDKEGQKVTSQDRFHVEMAVSKLLDVFAWRNLMVRSIPGKHWLGRPMRKEDMFHFHFVLSNSGSESDGRYIGNVMLKQNGQNELFFDGHIMNGEKETSVSAYNIPLHTKAIKLSFQPSQLPENSAPTTVSRSRNSDSSRERRRRKKSKRKHRRDKSEEVIKENTDKHFRGETEEAEYDARLRFICLNFLLSCLVSPVKPITRLFAETGFRK
ncbi:hypothetical protein F5050DRAFT_1713655 [Lentinula boryana]|uniref:BZIP domain-containing protein n=1 Tax=Lentinula boryana TaxID=40481 RepID=A0ABQ8Q7Q7_9AGAR|nr:hypothetical protein F5050DRAFT_1713655 [Lentinula boryana]